MMQTGKTILTSYFEWKGHDITVQISMLSGKEWVYVDDELVSQKSNWCFKSSHMIEIEGEKLTNGEGGFVISSSGLAGVISGSAEVDAEEFDDIKEHILHFIPDWAV